jgi:hypothetical protein
MAERLAGLRQDLGALCTLIFDQSGRIVAEAGELPVGAGSDALLNTFLEILNGAARISHDLEAKTPQDLIVLNGLKFDFFLLHVGASMGLVAAVLHSTWAGDRLGQLSSLLHTASNDFQTILAGMGVEVETPVAAPPQEQAVIEADIPISQEDLAELDAIFNLAQKTTEQQPKDVDAFWDSLVQTSGNEISRADTISFEQARQLGLAPEE